jgi:hypothetical protein
MAARHAAYPVSGWVGGCVGVCVGGGVIGRSQVFRCTNSKGRASNTEQGVPLLNHTTTITTTTTTADVPAAAAAARCVSFSPPPLRQ